MVDESISILRKYNKLTQNDVAEKLGVDKSTYSRYENGQIIPGATKLKDLAGIFGVGIESLFSDIDFGVPFKDFNYVLSFYEKDCEK